MVEVKIKNGSVFLKDVYTFFDKKKIMLKVFGDQDPQDIKMTIEKTFNFQEELFKMMIKKMVINGNEKTLLDMENLADANLIDEEDINLIQENINLITGTIEPKKN